MKLSIDELISEILSCSMGQDLVREDLNIGDKKLATREMMLDWIDAIEDYRSLRDDG